MPGYITVNSSSQELVDAVNLAISGSGTGGLTQAELDAKYVANTQFVSVVGDGTEPDPVVVYIASSN